MAQTPKEKALELVEKFYVPKFLIDDISWVCAKEFAIIAVDEILSQLDYQYYWQQVKEEINKL